MKILPADSELAVYPSFLVREMIEQKPFYYKGFREVLNQTLGFEEIMGSSDTQSLLIHLVLQFLYASLPPKQYIFAGNEAGLYISKNDNLALNIAIFEKTSLLRRGFRNQYFDVPPLAVIEVDIKSEGETAEETDSYYFRKTQKLLNFGVQEVIWIFSDVQKISLARQNQDWLVADWSKEILLLGQYPLCLQKMLDEEDIDLNFNDATHEDQ
jgi:hypothetical protein